MVIKPEVIRPELTFAEVAGEIKNGCSCAKLPAGNVDSDMVFPVQDFKIILGVGLPAHAGTVVGFHDFKAGAVDMPPESEAVVTDNTIGIDE